MELDIKEQKRRLEEEVNTLGSQIESIDRQLNQFAMVKQNLTNQLLKKMGALELLNSLNSNPTDAKRKVSAALEDKPKEATIG